MNQTSTKLSSLPLLKDVNLSEINTKDAFKRGEKSIWTILKLGIFAALGYGFVVYALPQIMILLGMTAGVILSVAAVILAIVLAPAYMRWTRNMARVAAKLTISQYPFLELERQKAKLIENVDKFVEALSNIANLKGKSEKAKYEAEKSAKQFESDMRRAVKKATELKEKLDEGYKTMGKEKFESTEEFINLYTEFQKEASLGDRLKYKFEQQAGFVDKYVARETMMQQLLNKLRLAETQVRIKADNFDATIDILKNDFEYAKSAKDATDSARKAMRFDEGWEVEYAIDVITSNITQFNAITAANFKDIDAMTSLSLDSEEMYESLKNLVGDIDSGAFKVTEAKPLAPNAKLTQENRKHLGDGFGDTSMF